MEMGFNVLVIIACLLLLFFCIYLEVKRENKHWLAGRILGNILLFGSLALIAIPLFYQKKEVQLKNTLIIITTGANVDSLSKIQGKKCYTEPLLHRKLKGKATYLPDLAYYLSEHPTTNSLQIFGYGLPEQDLKKLDSISSSFYPAAAPSGLVTCHWIEKLKQEEVFTVQGRYRNNASRTVQLKLIGFGTTLDSTIIAANTLQDFSLKHQIRNNGKAVLQLIGLLGKDTVSKENVPIQSFPKTPVKTFMLTSFPSFEYKFLKNWLYEKQYPVAARSRISKDKFSTDFLNRDSIKLANISLNQLQKEDVLMIDQNELENITVGTRQTLMQAVEKGLGLIVWVDEPNAGSLQKRIKQVKNLKDDKLLRLTIIDQQQGLSELSTDLKWLLSIQKGQQALINNQRNQTIALQELYGSGKITYTTLSNSYQWLLNGRQEDYANYWTSLINAVARKQSTNINLNTGSLFPVINEKLKLYLSTDNSNAPKVSYQNKSLTVNQNLLFPNHWEAQVWPLKSGWQTTQVNKKAEDFYVFEKQAWSSIKISQTIQSNLDYSLKTNTETTKPLKKEVIYKKEVSKWWFLIVLVLSSSFLWFEKRHHAKN
ncbi:hypothetical protein [Pedobacter ureilyticus]|uniref:VWA domain-containing protein n=1 Tax=Pedobacter ureilyticus TaxID=1393051 RepID=A0ABW9J7R1_9SPHI